MDGRTLSLTRSTQQSDFCTETVKSLIIHLGVRSKPQARDYLIPFCFIRISLLIPETLFYSSGEWLMMHCGWFLTFCVKIIWYILYAQMLIYANNNMFSRFFCKGLKASRSWRPDPTKNNIFGCRTIFMVIRRFLVFR